MCKLLFTEKHTFKWLTVTVAVTVTVYNLRVVKFNKTTTEFSVNENHSYTILYLN